MADRLSGKVAIVTGAAQGQGAETARLFAREGAKVAALDTKVEALEELADASDAQIMPIACDVSDSSAVRASIDRVVSQFGPITVLCNNAGVSIRRDGPWDESQDGGIADITEELFDKVISINLKGQFLMSKYVIPQMVDAGGGSIINIASVGGVFVGSANNAYCVSKGGVLGLTRALAFSYGSNQIRSNIVCPGFIETPMVARYLAKPELAAKHLEANPMGRVGQPSEIANVSVFLASDESSYMNGAVLTVDGGAIVRTV